jgi:hypothetical protein
MNWTGLIKQREKLHPVALLLAFLCAGLMQTEFVNAQTTRTQNTPAESVAKQLRTNEERRDAVDAVFGDIQIVDANRTVAPQYHLINAKERIDGLNLLIDKNWLGDISLTLTRAIGLRPDAAMKLIHVIVDTIFAQSPAPSSVFGFCAIQPSSACTNRDSFTDTNLHAMRGFDKYPLTPDLAINRVLPISKPAGVAIGATFAAQNLEAALSIKPLDPSNLKSTLVLCEANYKSIMLTHCVQAGVAHYLARKGLDKHR